MFCYNSTLSNSTCAHGAQFKTQHSTLNIHIVAHPGARTWCHALPWWAFSLLAILSDRSSRKQKYLDYDDVSADGVEPPQGPCRARDGVGVISSLSIPRNSISDHAARCRVLHTSREDHRMSWPSVHSSQPRNAHYWVSC